MFKRTVFWRCLFIGLCFVVTKPLNASMGFEVINEKCYKKIEEYANVSRADITRYKKIFKAIREGDIKKADSIAEDIENDILMGHVKAEKYLSKNYKSTYEELKEWLENYADHHQAKRIYNLAAKKGDPEGLVNPHDDLEMGQRFYSPYSWYNENYEKARPKYVKYLRNKVKEFRKYINNGKTRRAKAILEDPTFRQRIPDKNYDAMSATLSLVYFLDNEDKLALAWTEKASRRSNDATANWVGGLAAWRLKKYDTAAKYFKKLAVIKDNDEWLVAAGGYWAYRVFEKQGKKSEAKKWLETAAKHNRTFHGILANHQLGKPIEYNWKTVSYYNDFSNDEYMNELVTTPSLVRAVLLLRAKNSGLAEKEIDYNYNDLTNPQKELALYLCKQQGMHPLAIKIAIKLKDSDKFLHYDEIAYPNPDWKPKGGWKVDKALAWALVHQESRFFPDAISQAGARGLMQLMPTTAKQIMKNSKVKVDNNLLNDVGMNLAMGQDYINYLLEKPYIDGNLFYLAVAYNAGPGNLLKWQKKMKYDNDPLMFIETIPARETRIYVERVMANYWIYNARLGKMDNTLDQLANNTWPTTGGRGK